MLQRGVLANVAERRPHPPHKGCRTVVEQRLAPLPVVTIAATVVYNVIIRPLSVYTADTQPSTSPPAPRCAAGWPAAPLFNTGPSGRKLFLRGGEKDGHETVAEQMLCKAFRRSQGPSLRFGYVIIRSARDTLCGS